MSDLAPDDTSEPDDLAERPPGPPRDDAKRAIEAIVMVSPA